MENADASTKADSSVDLLEDEFFNRDTLATIKKYGKLKP